MTTGIANQMGHTINIARITMNIKIKALLAAAVLTTCTACITTARASSSKTYLQPFICNLSHDASEVGFVNVPTLGTVLSVFLQDKGDQGGEIIGGFKAFEPTSGTVTVLVTPTATSSNLYVALQVAGTFNGKQVQFIIPPTTVATINNDPTYVLYTFNLETALPDESTMLVKELAVIAQQSTGSPGSLYIDQIHLNGSEVRDRNKDFKASSFCIDTR